MRKQLLAFLSMVGLASPASLASAQVLKGSKPNEQKNESQVKASKQKQEKTANQTAYKERKAGGEQEASQKQATIKLRKAGGEQEAAASKDAAKMTKAGSEKTTVGSATGGAGSGKVATHDIHFKNSKSAAETNAVKTDATKKVLIGLSEPRKADAAHKLDKSAAETQAAQQASQKKVDKGLKK